MNSYLFSHIKLIFASIFLFGYHITKLKKKNLFKYQNQLSFNYKILIYNFYKHFTSFGYLSLVFLECKALNCFIYYFTSILLNTLQITNNTTSKLYSHLKGNYAPISNYLGMAQMKNFSPFNSFNIKSFYGLILNLSTYFHKKSALRFFRKSSNIVISTGFSSYIDYFFFTNNNSNYKIELLLYIYFQKLTLLFNPKIKQLSLLIYQKKRRKKLFLTSSF